MALMFSARPSSAEDSPANRSAARFFAMGAAMLGEEDSSRLGPLPFVLAGTLEGLGSLAAGGRLPRERVDEVTDAAVRLLLPAILEQLAAAGERQGGGAP